MTKKDLKQNMPVYSQKVVLINDGKKSDDPAVQRYAEYITRKCMRDMEAKIITDTVVRALDNKEGLVVFNEEGTYEEMSYEELLEDKEKGFPRIIEHIMRWYESNE